MAVAVSISENLPGTCSDHAHAAEEFTFVELLIQLMFQEVTVELAALTLRPEVGVLGADPPWRWLFPPRNIFLAPLAMPMPQKGSRS
jgi:hypothetical protein